MLGDADVVLAGGMESMSLAPDALKKNLWEAKMECVVNLMIYDGPRDVFGNYNMGITAENVAEKCNVMWEEQGECAAKNQNKVEDAIMRVLLW